MDRTAISRALLGAVTLVTACRGDETPGQTFDRVWEVLAHLGRSLRSGLGLILDWISRQTWDDWLAMVGWVPLVIAGTIVFLLVVAVFDRSRQEREKERRERSE